MSLIEHLRALDAEAKRGSSARDGRLVAHQVVRGIDDSWSVETQRSEGDSGYLVLAENMLEHDARLFAAALNALPALLRRLEAAEALAQELLKRPKACAGLTMDEAEHYGEWRASVRESERMVPGERGDG